MRTALIIVSIPLAAFGVYFLLHPSLGRGTIVAHKELPAPAPAPPTEATSETATFGNGCFWCTEAVFLQLNGVKSVVSGYSGGHVKNPTYDAVCSGATGHAEVVQIEFDPKVITYPELLVVFWASHDPTTLNRQGNDRGTQYRSAIFHHTPLQKAQAEEYMKRLEEKRHFDKPIVTEIVPFVEFYPAEDYHKNYFAQNAGQGYCCNVIQPKVDKIREAFKDKLKK